MQKNKDKDGNIGGTKYAVKQNNVPKDIPWMCDKYLTVLEITAPRGDPVLVLIFLSRNET
jgi:hypothetical protein